MPGIFIVIVVWILGVVGASALVHELGHAWIARAVGWKVVCLRWKWYGVALVADPNGSPEQAWKVAAGGLAATTALALCFLVGTALPQPVSSLFPLGFAFNAVILLTNLVPLRSFDGGQVLAGVSRDKESGRL